MFKKLSVSLWFLVLLDSFAAGQLFDSLSQGDTCTTGGESGVCSKVSECPPIINQLLRSKRNHVVCGFDGLIQIVCCPINQPTIPTAKIGIPNRIITNRISASKCDEYKEFAYEKIYFTNIIRKSRVNKVLRCAFSSISLIVGGVEAKVGEFPHMALIGSKYENNTINWQCGGSLISERFVLTAAHCAVIKNKYVRLGEHDLNQSYSKTKIDLRVVDTITHPSYRAPSQYNDIALFKLERNVEFNAAIRPACLPEESAVPTEKAIASGWGAISSRGPSSHVLLKVLLEMFSQSECYDKYAVNQRKLSQGIVEKYQVCAGSHTERKDTCQGDSGGPLQIYHKIHECTYTVVGVTSFGAICGTVRTPGVYTRVYAYLDWIESIVWPNN